ncbi:50S ribosomal protein L29 [bacterium CG10_46_32]|nr:MAG: 50S ribosomal protein L29 [bacterium CG10_46_32]PIR56404.1 MAG: 50S ribosomal protein L29 [Parcubacteria group bacterium CG10_big_fil_rev_8_21_14_0_10_46_32]
MKWTEIKTKQVSELEHDLATAKARIVDLRFKAQSGALKHVHEIGSARKEISHLLTRIHQLRHTDGSSDISGKQE